MEASQWNNLVAGTLAGIATSLILHPIDLVKVRFQVQDGVAVRVRYTSIPAAVGSIWREEGLRGFYRGVVPACVGSGLSWGLYFHFYEACKARLLRSQREEAATAAAATRTTSGGASTGSRDGLSTSQHMYAAWEAGTITCFLTNPVWLIKTRMQLQTGEGAAGGRREYRGLVDAFRCILREEGFRGLYRGLVPALLLTSHGMIQFGAYERLKAVIPAPTAAAAAGKKDGEGGSTSSSLSSALTSLGSSSGYYFALGAASKAVATTATYPSQVIKARIQQRGNAILKAAGADAAASIPYNGFLATVRAIASREGVRGFYKGFAANLLRVTPQSAVTLVVYENVKLLMDTVVAPPPASARS